MIPEEIKNKINDEVETRYPVATHNNPEKSPYILSQVTFIHGANFGYTLSLTEIEGLKKENERLKQVAKNAFYTFCMKPFPHNHPTYAEFCKENNI